MKHGTGLIKSFGYSKVADRPLAKLQYIPREYNIDTGDVMNQGRDNICVPCSLQSVMTFKEGLKKKDYKVNTFDIFNNRKNQDSKDGMAVIDALDQLVNKYKLIETYAKCTSSEIARLSLFLDGPLILALPVKSESDTFWKHGTTFGYHAVCLTGYDTDGFILKNSWGTQYGYGGYTNISFADFNRYTVECWTIIN